MQLSEAEINKRKYFQKSSLPYSITPTTFKKMLSNKAKQQLREVRASSINEVIGEREGRRYLGDFRKSDRVAHTKQLNFFVPLSECKDEIGGSDLIENIFYITSSE